VQEAKMYEKVGIEVRLQTFGGKAALVMPHFTPVNFATIDATRKAEIKEALTEFANVYRLHHRDMKPEHVVYQSPIKHEKGKIRFIDMAAVREVSPDKTKDALADMMKKLHLESFTSCNIIISTEIQL
jgi:hypothetical protein